jgi:hypothetical protein
VITVVYMGLLKMARNDPQVKVRLPKDVKAFIAAEAAANASSQSSEIVRAIRAAMIDRVPKKLRRLNALAAQAATGLGKVTCSTAKDSHGAASEKNDG